MLSDTQKQMLSVAIAGVRQKRQMNAQEAAARKHDGTKALLAAGTQKGNKQSASKPKTSSRKTAAKQGAASTITPYLTSADLMETSNAVSNAENTVTGANFGFATAAADALRAQGNIGRSGVAAVAGANDDAASRGLYDSGIRAGNVGMAQQATARGQQGARDALAMSAAQSIAQRNAAKQTLGSQLSIMTQRAAENGMALPVDPYAKAPVQGTNVKGTPTARKARR